MPTRKLLLIFNQDCLPKFHRCSFYSLRLLLLLVFFLLAGGGGGGLSDFEGFQSQ